MGIVECDGSWWVSAGYGADGGGGGWGCGEGRGWGVVGEWLWGGRSEVGKEGGSAGGCELRRECWGEW